MGTILLAAAGWTESPDALDGIFVFTSLLFLGAILFISLPLAWILGKRIVLSRLENRVVGRVSCITLWFFFLTLAVSAISATTGIVATIAGCL